MEESLYLVQRHAFKDEINAVKLNRLRETQYTSSIIFQLEESMIYRKIEEARYWSLQCELNLTLKVEHWPDSRRFSL